MEERLSGPLPVLPLTLPRNVSNTSIQSLASTGPWTTPGPQDDTRIVIEYQAAALSSSIDRHVLYKKLPKLAGAFSEIEQVPMIKSYMNLLLLLKENDSDKQWTARIPYDQEEGKFLTNIVEPLIRADKRFSFRVTRLYEYGLAKDERNDLCVDYMLLDFMDGIQMPMWTETLPVWEQKEQSLEQVADIYVEMLSKPVTYHDRQVLPNPNNPSQSQKDFENFDLPPTNTASSYMYDFIDEEIRGKFERLCAKDVLEKSEELGTTIDRRFDDLLILLLMRSLIPSYVLGRYNDSPFYITHPDLHNRNIIIDREPDEDGPPVTTRQRSKTLSLYPTRPAQFSKRLKSKTIQQTGQQKLKLIGLIDWDDVHPIPLQLAAIYPKFLETLPGAEFPDLPKSYSAPDMTEEKALFFEILRRKEHEQTGYNTFADLMQNGSWERNFFTAALRRGGVRQEWTAWWKKSRSKPFSANLRADDAQGLEELSKVLAGLTGFLSKKDNRAVVEDNFGWSLVWKILLEVERLELEAVECSWASFWSLGFSISSKYSNDPSKNYEHTTDYFTNYILDSPDTEQR